MTSSDVKDVLLGLAAVFGPIAAYLAATRGRRIDAEVLRETKAAEIKQRVDDSTGAHVLAAWKVTLEEVKEERAALERSRAESRQEREDADRAREAAEHARAQARLDNELAAVAVARNAECQEQLEEIRAIAAKHEARLTIVENEHAACPQRIAELERASADRTVTIDALKKEIAAARRLLGLPESTL